MVDDPNGKFLCVTMDHLTMEALVLRDDQYAVVTADVGRALFSLVWKRPVPGPDFRRICIQGYMQVMQHKLRYWLTDSRLRGPIRPEDEEWVISDLTPKMFLIGLERLAIVTSEDPEVRGSIDRIVEEGMSRSPFQVAIFNEPVPATNWLLENVHSDV